MRPIATYRVQLHKGFTFKDAAAQADYLHRLGISHMYCSPYLQAAPGSMHGYDVVDHGRVNEELEAGMLHYDFCMALGRNHLGQILDIVPNHMAIGVRGNQWWWDVLENGRSSFYASYFDVQWDPPEQKLRNVLLMPILGDHYGRVLESGQLKIEREDGGFIVRYYDHVLPLAPRSMADLVREAGARVRSDELMFIGDSLDTLPASTDTDRESVTRRHRDKNVLRRRLGEICARDPKLCSAIDAAVERVNEDPDALDAILSKQNYRLAHWRTAGRELGYRRFFDINSLVGLRTEDPQVFRATHELILDWLSHGVIDGVRVDHPDGLRDPETYFNSLREAAPWAYIVAEKILEPGERLPSTWKVDGTTGYDFAFMGGNLFVDRSAEERITRFYGEFTGEPSNYHEVVRECKDRILRATLGSDVNVLTAQFVDICERHRNHRDYTRHDIHTALRAVVAAFPVYRTYIQPEKGMITREDIRRINEAVDKAKQSKPQLPADLFDFMRSILLLKVNGDPEHEFVARFQQFTGPAMAKGVEDTAFYNYNRLVSLNEVGGDPGCFGIHPDEFHRWCGYIQTEWPDTMLATSTHDTKRSEDVRCRISVLSEMPDEWEAAVRRWSKINERYRTGDLPDHNVEYLIYQTMVGAYPIGCDRLWPYIEKCVREAKTHTSWTDQNERYETALKKFVEGVCNDAEFAADVAEFVKPVIAAGRVNSLALTLLKMTAPGMPDTYQGTEIWDYSLVDPDNRRPVDYEKRREILDKVYNATAAEVLKDCAEGAPKLFLIRRALEMRARLRDAFGNESTYTAIYARGERAHNVIAFVRADQVMTVVPRLSHRVGNAWSDTSIEVPLGRWRNCLTGDPVESGHVNVSDLLAHFPVALLSKEG